MPDEFQTLKKERCIEIIKACNGSGMPKRQWCREHGISYSTFMRWQRSLRNELAGEIMVTQAVVPLQIEPQASRCTPAQEVMIQKDGISLSMHGVGSDMVIAIVRGLSSCYRKLRGLTQEELAERIDRTPAFIGHVEAPNIKKAVSLDTLFAIAAVLDAPAYRVLIFDD